METTINTDSSPQTPAERPQFLSVLCILTWVMCGFTFISSVWGIIGRPSPEEQYEQIEKIRESLGPEAAAKMEEVMEKQQDPTTQVLGTAFTLVSIGLSAFGAWLMWQLRRKGFYFYLGGELLPYLYFLFAGAEAMSAFEAFGQMGATAGYIFIGLLVLFDVLFIAMYAANLKHMRQ
jgi:hypothetical protein